MVIYIQSDSIIFNLGATSNATASEVRRSKAPSRKFRRLQTADGSCSPALSWFSEATNRVVTPNVKYSSNQLSGQPQLDEAGWVETAQFSQHEWIHWGCADAALLSFPLLRSQIQNVCFGFWFLYNGRGCLRYPGHAQTSKCGLLCIRRRSREASNWTLKQRRVRAFLRWSCLEYLPEDLLMLFKRTALITPTNPYRSLSSDANPQ